MPLRGAVTFKSVVGVNVASDALSNLGNALQERFDRTLGAFLSLAESATHYHCMKRAWVSLA